MSDDNTCNDCLYPGNGKCSDCNGTGLVQDVFEAVADALGDVSQDCETCHGTGKCQTCDGTGCV